VDDWGNDSHRRWQTLNLLTVIWVSLLPQTRGARVRRGGAPH
jgi:hypothetical protein